MADEVRAPVRESTPRLFAVVVEYDIAPGARDAYVAGWGMTDGDEDEGRAYVVRSGGGALGVLRAPESALRLTARPAGGTARLAWPDRLPVADSSGNA
ncbi:hypothetical protein [Streptomyces iconiensis]|uniref:Uncharacterized protein n=1 Tax=Streptomyces iconiensis TaxID=1384038 RepID=A0ABT6ZXI4_9ACTN|nr:hypothetical protein [Streptomyces iconiensis]MDJ1133769.1 hypothetical protein [Streptomyces iconiensis]